MDDHRPILKRVGLVLIAVGVLDIAVMIYSIGNGIAYSSSFNIIAVIAGIYLVRGSLGAVRVVTWFSAFYATAFGVGLIFLAPFVQPADLWLVQARTQPLLVLGTVIFAPVFILLLVWIYRHLRSPQVLSARVDAGLRAEPPRSAFLVAVALVVTLSILLVTMLRGESAEHAIELAREKVGTGYRLHVTGIRWSVNNVHADVTAYSETEIKSVTVEWQR